MDPILAGLVLMLLGMGTVFVFLVILLFSTKLMSKVIGSKKSAPAPAAAAAAPAATNVSPASSNDAEIAAAIAAAAQKKGK